MSLFDSLSTRARLAPESGIVAVFNHGRTKPGLIPLWAGEGDKPTPGFIADAAARALAAGETFYTYQRGIPALREALVRYHQRHFGRTFTVDDFVVCGSGMQAVQMAVHATCGPGDEALVISPAWPNFAGALVVAGATAVPVSLDRIDGAWTLDLDRLEASITPRTRAILINSPSNPTGWTADLETLRAILDMARRHDLWIIADEIYALFHYGDGRAPSFMDIMDPEERIIFVNTFSKNWAMTGWRVGWLTAHHSLKQVFENLVQYSTSGVPQFLQKGCVAALDEGDGFVAAQVAQARRSRDLVCDILRQSNRAEFVPPQGAFYLMFSVDGVHDSLGAALDIVDRALVGLAPGMAFGADGEGCFRLCFHRDPAQLEEACTRLVKWMGQA